MRATSSIRVIRDNDDERYRVVSMEDEGDPSGAAERRAKERFRDNLRLNGAGVVPLEAIRVVHITPSEAQLADWSRDIGPLPPEAANAELKMSLPFAVHEGRFLVLLDAFASLEPPQIVAFFNDHLFTLFEAEGIEPSTVQPVFIHNRLP